MPSAAVPESVAGGGGADPLVWDKERTCVLIELWCERPVLYDFTCDEYKDRNRRRAAVAEIAAELRAEEREVVKKMKNLRRQYSRERSLTEAAKAASAVTGEEPSFSSNWYYYRKMSFLDLFMNAKPIGAAARATELHQESLASDSSDSSRHDEANQFSSPGDWAAECSLIATVPPAEGSGDSQLQAGGAAGGRASSAGFFGGRLVASQQHTTPPPPDHCGSVVVASRPAASGATADGLLPLEQDSHKVEDYGEAPLYRRGIVAATAAEPSYSRGAHAMRLYAAAAAAVTAQRYDESDMAVGEQDTAAAAEPYEATGGRSTSEGMAGGASQMAAGIRRVPLSGINIAKRLKRKRQRIVGPTLPPQLPPQPGGGGRRLRASAADASSSSRPPPERQLQQQQPPDGAAGAAVAAATRPRYGGGGGSWDSDDVFGQFVADELRQIADVRSKRLAKFKMHAALLEAHRELPEPASSQWD